MVYMFSTQVKQSQIIKISLLVTLLVLSAKIIALFNQDFLSNSFISDVTIKDLLLRFTFMFSFSWLILQLNTNWSYQFEIKNQYLRLPILVVLNIAILLATTYIFQAVFPIITGGELGFREQAGFLIFIYTIVLIILVFIGQILRYQLTQQAQLVENERLKQQNLQKELTALKNQINPHFLFNSLNSLTSLVRDNKPATNFIKKLSYMYRYILQSGERDLVNVKEELKFLESYTYLIKTRYRNRFEIEIDIAPEQLEMEIPPLALQLLVENAVKHNEISESNPLSVKISSEENSILVKNKIRPRTQFVDSTGNGLTNLDKRYVLLKNSRISVSEENGIFSVKLPLK